MFYQKFHKLLLKTIFMNDYIRLVWKKISPLGEYPNRLSLYHQLKNNQRVTHTRYQKANFYYHLNPECQFPFPSTLRIVSGRIAWWIVVGDKFRSVYRREIYPVEREAISWLPPERDEKGNGYLVLSPNSYVFKSVCVYVCVCIIVG